MVRVGTRERERERVTGAGGRGEEGEGERGSPGEEKNRERWSEVE